MEPLISPINQNSRLCSYETGYQPNYLPNYDIQFVFYDEDDTDDEQWNDFDVSLPITGQTLSRPITNLRNTSNHRH